MNKRDLTELTGTSTADARGAIALYNLLRPALKRKKENGRFELSGGDKTEIGLYLSVKRVFDELKAAGGEKWWTLTTGKAELTDYDKEHIADLVRKGYTEGDLSSDEPGYGPGEYDPENEVPNLDENDWRPVGGRDDGKAIE